MKYRQSFTMLLTLLVICTGCGSSGTRGSGALTREKAQKALNKALDGFIKGGAVTVQGVREIPAENSAEADLNFQDFRWQAPLGLGSFSGTGTAKFSHYSDGRWVLTKIIWSYGTYLDANVEVN